MSSALGSLQKPRETLLVPPETGPGVRVRLASCRRMETMWGTAEGGPRANTGQALGTETTGHAQWTSEGRGPSWDHEDHPTQPSLKAILRFQAD